MSDPTRTPTPPSHGPYSIQPSHPGQPGQQVWAAPLPTAPKRLGTGAMVGIAAAVASVMSIVVFICTYSLTSPAALDPTPVAGPSSTRSASPTARATQPSGAPSPSVAPTVSASAGGLVLGEGKPTLRPGTAPKVFAEDYDGEAYTFDLKGWPFAFQAPITWGCIRSDDDKWPDATIWVCINEKDPATKQKMNIMLRRCDSGCSASKMRSLTNHWLDEEAKAVKSGARTWYVENAVDSDGYYTVDLSHFFADPDSGELAWQVGVFVRSKPEHRDLPRFALNSVLFQAG